MNLNLNPQDWADVSFIYVLSRYAKNCLSADHKALAYMHDQILLPRLSAMVRDASGQSCSPLKGKVGEFHPSSRNPSPTYMLHYT